jgi:hypothetical protein
VWEGEPAAIDVEDTGEAGLWLAVITFNTML